MKAVIADDEKMARLIIRKYVDWEGLGLTLSGEATDGEELLRLITELQPDIIITDIRMPVFSGLEIIARTLEMGLRPHFLITSAYTDFAYTREAMRLGVEDFLQKPMEKGELNEALQRIVEKIRQTGPNTGMVSSLIRQACLYMETYFGEKLSLDDIASYFYISPNYFSSLFKKEMGVNYMDYLTDIRMREAKKLLSDPRVSVAEAAQKTGYRDASHFSAVFSKTYGRTPSAWRRSPQE